MNVLKWLRKRRSVSDRIGRNEDGNIEIVVSGVDLHIEQMGKKFWWIGIYKGDKRMALNIHSNKAVILYVAVNELFDDAVKARAKGELEYWT